MEENEIAPVDRRLNLVRPLLSLPKAQLVAHARARRFKFREDQSNASRDFLRNRIRHEVLPSLEAINPAIREALRQLADQSQADSAFLASCAKRHRARILKSATPGQVRIRLPLLRRLAPSLQRQLIRDAIEQVQGDLTGFEFRHWQEIARLLPPQARGIAHLPDGLRLARVGDDLLCEVATQGILTRL